MIKVVYKDKNKQNPKEVFRVMSFITQPIANGTAVYAVVARLFDNVIGKYAQVKDDTILGGVSTKYIQVNEYAGDIMTIPINQLKVVDTSKEDDLTNDRKKYLKEIYLLLNNEELPV